jgi:Methyltransferase FkbM domain
LQAVNAGLWSKKATIGMVSEHGDWGKIFVEVPPGTEGALDAYGVADIAAKFDIPAFDFIKIDIEGAEGMVFEPDADFSWIQTTKLLSLEVHDYFAPHFGLTVRFLKMCM